MKKTVLSLSCLAIIGTSTGQIEQKAYSFDQVSSNLFKHSIQSNQNFTPKSFEVLYEDNFEDANNWTIDNDGQLGDTYGWAIKSTSDSWIFDPISSTSGESFAQVNNGPNPETPALGVTYTLTTANPIDIEALGGTSNISLKYEQYGARFNDLQETLISVDGGETFILVASNDDKEVLTIDGGAPYPNPELKTINLAPFLNGTTPDSLHIQFRWTSDFPDSQSNGAWITYGWMIDDLSIIVTPAHDLSVKSSYWGGQEIQVFSFSENTYLDFYTIPQEQNPQINFTANVHNLGTMEQTNVSFDLNINEGEYTDNISIPSLSVGDSNFYNLTFNPTTAQMYNVVRTINADSTDLVPNNNNFEDITFNVNSNFIYARDNMTNSNVINVTDAEGYHLLYGIFENQVLSGIDVGIAGNSSVNSAFIVTIYDWETGDFIAETEEYFINQEDLGSVVSLPVFNNSLQRPTLEAGKVYDVAITNLNPGVNLLGGGKCNPFTAFYTVGNAAGSLDATPVMRLNFDPTLNLANANESFSVGNIHPNPTTETAHINFNLINDTDIKVIVTDITGKVMTTQNLGTLVAGSQSATVDASSFANGIYFVTIEAGNSQTTQKFIKK